MITRKYDQITEEFTVKSTLSGDKKSLQVIVSGGDESYEYNLMRATKLSRKRVYSGIDHAIGKYRTLRCRDYIG